jgi:hypothetical protein
MRCVRVSVMSHGVTASTERAQNTDWVSGVAGRSWISALAVLCIRSWLGTASSLL